MTKHLDVRALQAVEPLAPATVTDLEAVEHYVLHWARNPDPGSFFAKFTWFIQWLPDSLYLGVLRIMWYGGTILFLGGVPIGHVFYQRQWFSRRNEVHMFSIEVEEPYRKLGYANLLMQSFLDEMGRREQIDVLRISAGGDEAVKHMWLKTLRGGYNLDYVVESYAKPGLGWVKIAR